MYVYIQTHIPTHTYAPYYVSNGVYVYFILMCSLHFVCIAYYSQHWPIPYHTHIHTANSTLRVHIHIHKQIYIQPTALIYIHVYTQTPEHALTHTSSVK
ncbi:hypothetical protein EON63_11910 [archaeon]|nr:MAG: hypothetical protein EON63_11910 [archaeon]